MNINKALVREMRIIMTPMEMTINKTPEEAKIRIAISKMKRKFKSSNRRITNKKSKNKRKSKP